MPAGSFTTIGGATRNRIAALDADPVSPTSAMPPPGTPTPSNTVNALAVSGSTVYAGGDFTTIGGATRNRIAALDASTGSGTAWDPNADGAVYALAVSRLDRLRRRGLHHPAGSRGRPHDRYRIAAIDASTGTPTSWNPSADGTVRTLCVSGTSIYAGGDFTTLQGATGGPYSRYFLAEIDAATGDPTNWDPVLSDAAHASAVYNDVLYAGGSFATISGEPCSCFAVFEWIEPPTVTAIAPASSTNEEALTGVQITGTDFEDGATVSLRKLGHPDIAATNVVVVSDTQITCDLDLTGAATGTWDVVVTNPDTAERRPGVRLQGQLGMGLPRGLGVQRLRPVRRPRRQRLRRRRGGRRAQPGPALRRLPRRLGRQRLRPVQRAHRQRLRGRLGGRHTTAWPCAPTAPSPPGDTTTTASATPPAGNDFVAVSAG